MMNTSGFGSLSRWLHLRFGLDVPRFHPQPVGSCNTRGQAHQKKFISLKAGDQSQTDGDPNGTLNAGALGRSFRKRISVAQLAPRKTAMDPEASATNQRNVPLDASIHATNAYNTIATVGV